MKKQPKKTEQTKQELLAAFCKLYSKKPIGKITVQEITRKAGYNRCTFYQYFSDIYEILDYIENDVLNHIEKEAPKESITELNVSLVKEFANFYEEKEVYLAALFGNFGSKRFSERLIEKIPFEWEELVLSENKTIAPYLIEFHRVTAFSLFQLWQKRKKDLSIEELADLVYRLKNQGISGFI